MLQTELVASFRQHSSFSTGPRYTPPTAYQGSNDSAYVLRDTPPRTRTEGTRLSTLVRHLLYDALRA